MAAASAFSGVTTRRRPSTATTRCRWRDSLPAAARAAAMWSTSPPPGTAPATARPSKRSGARQGRNFDGLAAGMKIKRHPVVLSGGVSSMEDVRRDNASGAAGVILGKALYEGKLSLAEALAAAG